MKISLIAVGKLKTPHWLAAQKEYAERIRRYSILNIIEVKDRVGQGLDDKTAVLKEGDDILKSGGEGGALISLNPDGQTMDSPAWAKRLQKLSETYSRMAFVLGGPNGLSQAVLDRSVLRLSLSSMTFPHDMARVIFLEQLYRAFTLLNREKYHK